MLKPGTQVRLFGQTLVAVLLFALGQNAFALHISELLDTMRSADRELNYQGVLVLRKQDRLLSMRVRHAADENGVRETLQTLNGERRRVIRDNERVLSIYPERNLVIVSPDNPKSRLHPRLPENLGSLQAYYDIRKLDNDRIADQPAAVLQLTPKDAHRYGYRYWVDANTGVLLRCDLTSEDDNIIEQMMFVQLEYSDAMPPSQFSMPDTAGYQLRQLGHNRIESEHVDWQVNNLPPGFVLTRSSLTPRHEQDPDQGTLHLVYSDGLASVSVFIEPYDENSDGVHFLNGARNMGALNAYGLRHGSHTITVMGEVPASTVQQIALSTEYTGEPTDDAEDDDAEPEIGD